MREEIRNGDDESLVAAVLDGDRAAFDELYDRYLQKVYEFAYRRVGNREDAENITSDVFLKVFKNLSWFKGSSFRAWLWAIVRNQVSDYWRERYRAEALIDGLLDLQASDSEEEEDGARCLAIVERILGALPYNYRAVLELRFLKGFTLVETANELGITEGNAKVIQHRALKKAAELGWV